jgi:ribonuclease Z
VAELGLEIGPWLNEFKQALFTNEDRNSKFVVCFGKNNLEKKFVLGDLADQIALITPGQKVSYVVDVMYNQSNVDKMVKLAKNADQLFIEAAFLEKDKDIAQKKCHLTARQAGSIAGKAQVKQFTPFHFSPRYMGLEDLLEKESKTAYEQVIQKM